ncbi:branched-chain amino acid ABC transporter substrate-binding protein [Actinomadura craniellae]|uniref:Branched-chain amino acid ABC transporter substrate-binding protein n=1 Tax=Actinomadura craniellae TaxID=2231787 RepID=A0A365GYK7_9ACTN|nr:branched-chain amino acid ABC transporter ATP-binding protein/permease [Actinomadura craniellae]RAY11920.1 branched-chain amino acid ABC transporter substrate-binding protein [Actinomadura craniellae]
MSTRQRLSALALDTPAPAIAAFVLVALLPLFGLAGHWQQQLALIAIYTLICSGLNLSFGYAGELALGQVAVFASGAYISAILYQHGFTDILGGFAVAVCLAAVTGLLTGIPGLRLSRWALALVSFFYVLLVPELLKLFESETGGTAGLAGILAPTFFGWPLGTTGFYVVAVVVTLLWMLLQRNLIVSRFGQFLRILSASPTLTESLGGSVYRLRVQAYVIGALPAGLAGVLYTYLTGFVSPEAFTLHLLIALLAATVVGGAASVWGAPVGAAILVLGPLQLKSFEEYSTLAYGVFLVVIGTAFSGGLAGLARKLRDRVLPRPGPQGAGDGESAADLSIPGTRMVVAGVEKSFAGLRALSGVDLTVEPGTIAAIIGPNGAGKTTLLNLVSGLLPADTGRVELAGRELTGLRAHQVSRLGVGRTFQTPVDLGSMSVLEVVESGRFRKGNLGSLSAILRLPKYHRVREADRKAAVAALSFAGLEHAAAQDAASLPLGTRRLLEVVRSVAGEPSVLLLDEPAAGLDDSELRELGMLMRRIRDAGGTVVLVEHNVPFVMDVADQVFAMELGRVIAAGPPEVVRRDQRVIDSYLGRRGRREPADHELDPRTT